MKFWIDGGSVLVVTFIVLISGLSTIGLVWLVDRLWERDVRRRHNDVAGYMISVVAVVYAVLLGFVTVTVWENYDKASASVGDEAVLIADIYRDVAVLPQSVANAVRRDLVSYATAVIGEEWPMQMAGQQVRSTHSALDKVPQHLMDAATSDPTTVVFLRCDDSGARLISEVPADPSGIDMDRVASAMRAIERIEVGRLAPNAMAKTIDAISQRSPAPTWLLPWRPRQVR